MAINPYGFSSLEEALKAMGYQQQTNPNADDNWTTRWGTWQGGEGFNDPSFNVFDTKELESGFANKAQVERLQQGNLGGFTPKAGNTPTYDQWLASQGPGYAGGQGIGNDPYMQYMQANYNIPSYGNDFLSQWGPAIVGGGLGGIALGAAGAGTGVTEAAALGGSAPFVAPEALGAGTALAAPGAAGAGAGAGIGTAAAAGGGVVGSTALGRLLGLGQTGNDLLSVAGQLGPSVLGYLGAQNQSDAYRDVSNQYLNIGAPYRANLQASYQPGFNLFDQPGYGDALQRTADISARGYSSKFGNPAGSPAAQAGILNDVWQQGYIPALMGYRGQLGQFGGLGLNTAGAGSLGGANVAGGTYDAIGLGLGRALTPQSPYEQMAKDIYRQYTLGYK